MKKICGPLFVTAVVGVCVAASRLAAEEGDLNARMLAFMTQQGVDPIEVKPGTRFQRDLDEDWLKWAERTIIAPFSKRAERWPEQQKEAVDFVRQAMRFRRTRTHPDPSVTPASLQKLAASLVEAGVNDPLVLMLQASALLKSTAAFNLLRRIPNEAGFKDISACERLLVIDDLWEIERALGVRNHSYGEQRVQDARLAIEDPAVFGPDEDEVLFDVVDFLFEPAMINSRAEKILPLCELPGLSEWSYHVMHGAYEETLAWKYRGGGFANTVTNEGRLGFQEHLPKAREHFFKAWQLKPTRVAAPTGMIRVVNAGAGKEGDSLRLWFDRAIAAQFDHIPAYDALLGAYRPQWGGSFERMKALGLACVHTGRHDTLVPEFVIQAMRVISLNQNDWRPSYQDDLLSAALMNAFDGQIANPARAWERMRLQADQGICAWASGDFKRAHTILKAIPSPLPVDTRELARSRFRTRENVVRGESAIQVTGQGAAWQAAESAYSSKQLVQADASYAAIAAAMGKDVPSLLANRIAAVKAETLLESGAWLRMNVTPALEDWDIQSGDWDGTAGGALVHRGVDKPAMIIYAARIGPNFEFRGEYEVEAPPGQDQGLGFVLGFTGSTTRDWLLCTQFRADADHAGALLRQFYPTSTPTVNLGKLPEKRTFFVRCKDGKITFTVNDKDVVKDHMPLKSDKEPVPLTVLPDSRVGFTNYTFPSGTVTRLLKAEVRRLQ